LSGRLRNTSQNECKFVLAAPEEKKCCEIQNAAVETPLAFPPIQSIVVTMEKSWLGKMISHPQKLKSAMVPFDVDYADADVQFSLGLKFASGAGATADYAQAADWYRKAAEQNHGLAQFNLGIMYAHGQGVARDDAQSVVWFGRAANLGDAGGQYHMGRIRQRTSLEELPAEATESRIEAYKWFQLAAAQGYQNSDIAYATLTFKMSWADVTEAIERVAKFSPTKTFMPPVN
jgi:TPR repeat protein